MSRVRREREEREREERDENIFLPPSANFVLIPSSPNPCVFDCPGDMYLFLEQSKTVSNFVLIPTCKLGTVKFN